MVQNPNTFVQNFIDKRGKVFTGTIASSTLATLTNIKHKYAYVDFLVSDASAATKFSFLSGDSISYANKRNPLYKEVGDSEWLSATGFKIETTGKKRYIVDVSNIDSLVIYADYYSTGTTTVEIYVSFCNEETERNILNVNVNDKFLPYAIDKRAKLFDGEVTSGAFLTINDVKGKFIHLDINVVTASSTQKIALLANNSYSDPNNPRFCEEGSNDWKKNNSVTQTLDITKTGWKHYIVDMSFISKLVLYATSGSANIQVLVSVDNDLNNFFPQKLTDDFLPYATKNKVGLIHSGIISENRTISYTDIKQQYALIKLVINSAGTGLLRIYKNLYNEGENGPAFRDLYSNVNVSNNVVINGMSVGAYYYYSDISHFSDINLRLNNGTADVNVYLSFVDELPILAVDPSLPTNTSIAPNPYTGYKVVVNGGSIIKDDFTNKLRMISGKYAVFYVNTMSVSSNIGRLGITWKDIDGNKVTTGVRSFNDKWDNQPSYDNLYGIVYTYYYKPYTGYVFVDVEKLNLSYVDNIQNVGGTNVTITFITQTSDITPYLADVRKGMLQPQLFVNLRNAKLQYYKFINVAYGDYWIQNYTSSIAIGKNDDYVLVPLSSLNHGNISNTICSPTLMPYYTGEQLQNKYMAIVIGCADGTILRCDITDINNATTASNWTVCNFWEKKGTGRKIPTKNSSAVDTYHRYDTTLPDDRYNYDNVSNGFIQFQGSARMGKLGLPAYTKRGVAVAQYDINGRRCNLFVSDDGGVNFYSLFDFVNASLENASTILDLCANINTSAFANYSSGLQMFKVTRNIPSEATKEPASKYTLSEITDFSITKGTSTIITKAAHGLNNLDIVVFTGGTGTDWSQIASENPGENSLGGNAYYVKKINDNSFYIVEYTGSYDTQLSCRHIHCVHQWQEGFIIGTGEEYPNSWFIHVGRSSGTKSSSVADATWVNYRFNSSENGVQRPCGIIVNKDIQPTLLFGADTHIMRLGDYEIPGRTEKLGITSFGIYKIALKDIDDMSKAVRVCDCFEQVLVLYKVGNIIVAKMQMGGVAFSFDSGETWEFIPDPKSIDDSGNVEINGQYHGKIVIGNGYVLEYK